MKPSSLVFGVVLSILILAGPAFAQKTVEFSTGRPRPPIDGWPVLGSGLALTGGYFRGVPVGELSGWTVSLWFQANSNRGGEIFGIVTNEQKGEAMRMRFSKGALTFQGASKRNKPGKVVAARDIPVEKWHHVVVTYDQGEGPVLYINAEPVDRGERAWFGNAAPFNNYHFGAALLGGGKFGNYFDGLIDDFSLYRRALTPDEVARTFQGELVEDGLVAFNDFENVNHRDLAVFTDSDRDEAYLDEGRKLYQLHCIACHSKDGVAPPPNPLSRIFTKNAMENGGDPYSMFRTVTYGFRNMMPSVQLNPEERYKVIHYIREKMVKEHSPELYVPVNEGYADAMPRGQKGAGEEALRVEMLAKTGYLRDYGRALCSPVQGGRSEKNRSLNALTIDLGDETTISYDLGTMRSIGAWTGGFLDFSNTLHHKLRAPGLPLANFESLPGAESWRWAWDGKAEKEIPDLGSLTVYPEDQVRYRGHYPYGDEIVVSYAVQGRGVLESPLAEKSGETVVVHHRLTIEPGDNALELVALEIQGSEPAIKGDVARIESGGRSHLAWLQGDAAGLKWRAGKKGELVLVIPASEQAIYLNVALAAVEAGATAQPENHVVDLSERTRGGPRRWTETHTMKGKLATSTFQGYAMDSVSVPLKNSYNSWMRTSALGFFPDGRLAVGTLAGDIWIVSGLDDELEEVTWKRFAAGLYEPLGMKVVDGVLTLATRGRIVKLHDYNDDGEADFYEAFFNEREPSAGWHAYNFDLVVGDDGSYYYARVGGFSEWSIPGGLVRVSPDGEKAEVLGIGMRVPNGIGQLPDGRITYGDNQGTYVPASKIVVGSHPGSFLGAGKWDQREGNYDPETIVDPIVYMPQELDSSSGAQLWVDEDDRFGPLSGQYFHTSYGRARTMYIMLDEFDDTTQGAVYPLPLKMESGTMRVAKSPVDGQLYFTGLTGWQAGATQEGSVQRLRFTGEEGIYLVDAKARAGRLELTFNRPLDQGALNLPAWDATAWNYQWSNRYGSPHFKVSEPGVEGEESFRIEDFELKDQGRRLVLRVPELQPCHTLKLDFSVSGEGGETLEGPLYFTIHRLPE